MMMMIIIIIIIIIIKNIINKAKFPSKAST